MTLAVVMKQRHNLLLLDEPTNHLDLDSREALEESLEDFPGSIVFVSHDRAFIDRLATRVIDLREGRAVFLAGNYTETADARAERRRRPEPPLAEPSTAPRPDPCRRRAGARRRRRRRRRARPSARNRREEKEAARRRRRIKALEEKIAGLEAEVEAIETRLWDEALTLGPVAAHELSKQKTARKEELDALVEEWGRLSEEAERVGGAAVVSEPARPLAAAIVAIGSEMLGPLRQDTNSLWLTARLEEVGIPVVRKSIVGDDPALVAAELEFAARSRPLRLHDGGTRPDRRRRDRRRAWPRGSGRGSSATRPSSRGCASGSPAAASRCRRATRSRRTSSSARGCSRTRGARRRVSGRSAAASRSSSSRACRRR